MPKRIVSLHRAAYEDPVDEWIYPAWSRVRGGPAAPGIVYVSEGIVVQFILVEPYVRRRWVPGPEGMRWP